MDPVRANRPRTWPALQEFYQGEILGEAMFDAMLQSARSDSERYKDRA